MRRRLRRRISPTYIVLLAIAALVAGRWALHLRGPSPPESLSAGSFEVRRVVDGDTLLLANDARVRLIGVDTPELARAGEPAQPFAVEAKLFTERFVSSGRVQLEMDRQRQDRYGRFLAYVHVDEVMLNEALLRAGLARARTAFHYSDAKKRLFREAEQSARDEGLGIWGDR